MKELKTEHYLQRGAFKFQYMASVRLAEVDIQASEENPSRLFKRIDEERVIAYGCSMEDKVEFPAIVLLVLDPVAAAPGKKYLIATGVHRYKAAELAKKSTVDAYVVDETDNYRRELLCRQLNTIEGQGVSMRDRYMQLLILHEKYDHPIARLAREWGLKVNTAQNYLLEDKANKRARAAGFDLAKYKITQRSIIALHAIQSNDVYEKALKVALFPNVSQSDVNDMAAQIKKAARDEKVQHQIADRFMLEAIERHRKASATHGRISSSAATKLLANCKRVLKNGSDDIDKLYLSSLTDPQRALTLVQETISYLTRITDEIERIVRMGGLAAAAE